MSPQPNSSNTSFPTFRWLCLVGVLCLGSFAFVSKVDAKTSFATFVVSVNGSTTEAQKQGAIMNWMVRRLTDHKASRAKGFVPLDRSMFFSRSRALGARRWLRKAKSRLVEGLKHYPGKPDDARSELRRAATFYHYTHPYYMDRKQYQRVLMMLSMLLYRNKQKQSAWRFLSRGVLLDPTFIPTGKLSKDEQNVVKAARCRLGKMNPSTLIIKARRGSRAVYLNGHLVGFGDQRITGLRAGEYYVSVREDGFRRWGRKRIRISPGATKTLYARNMRSSQNSFHQGMCQQVLPMKEGERLSDKIKEFSRTANVNRFWLGCFKADSSGKAGSLKWFFLKDQNTPAKTGTLPIISGFRNKFLLLAKLMPALGFVNPRRLPGGLMTYRLIPQSNTCPNIDNLLKKFMKPSKRFVVLYTRYGFRLQGKLLKQTPSSYTIEVTKSGNPPELQKVVVPASMVRYKWEPGKPQYQGFRLGERVVIHTVFGLSSQGRLVSIDDTQVQIKTRLGTESIPRSMIKSVHKRDR